MCKYCIDAEPYQDRTYEGCLLELIVNNDSLEVHFCNEIACIDYDQREIKINYCPFCGRKL